MLVRMRWEFGVYLVLKFSEEVSLGRGEGGRGAGGRNNLFYWPASFFNYTAIVAGGGKIIIFSRLYSRTRYNLPNLTTFITASPQRFQHLYGTVS